MAPELRKRTKSQTVVERPAVKKTKATPKRQAPEDASPVSVKKQKTVKEVKARKSAEEPKPRAVKGSKKKAAKSEPEPELEQEQEEEEKEEVAVEEAEVDEAETSIIPVGDLSDSEDGEDDEIDAEIQALAAGLDPEDDNGRTANAVEFKVGQDVGKIPNKLSKKEKKALAAARNAVKEEPGVIYVGRLPHGFYEHELKGYFGQFGPVSRLRLSRNKKTGKSKHYAFIEFSEESTAHIAAKTMDKYLLFGHILTVKFVGSDQLHPKIWKGANRRFKQTPWTKIAGNKLARPLTETAWEEKNSKEKQRRADRAEKLKAIGYEFEAPELKQAPAPLPVEAAKEAEKPEAVEEAPAVEETNGTAEVEPAEAAEAETPKATKAKKAKKGKKVKA